MPTTIDPSEFSSHHFDFVIVGGGTAGLVVASRLSENPNVSIGVIEAGDYIQDMDAINIPGLGGSAVMNESVDWRFSTVPQKYIKDRVIAQPRGKILGGTSALNLLVLGRASREEYDAYERLGNQGWNWHEFLKYFRKSETLTFPSSDVATRCELSPNPDCHGSDGPLQITYPRYFPELRNQYIDALKALGVPNNPDPACGSNIGSSLPTVTIHPEQVTRSYSTTAYYEQSAHRKNLVVLIKAQATKLILHSSSDGTVATGVSYVCGGTEYVVQAAREVILSAGSFQTPHLLELSGIGKKDILTKHNIPVVLELPVGENLQDHTLVSSSFETRSEYDTTDFLNEPEQREQEMNLYKAHRTGAFSSIHSSCFSFVPLRTIVTPEELQVLEKGFHADHMTSSGHSKQYDLLKSWLDHPDQAQVELIYRSHMRPDSGLFEQGKKYQTIVAASMNSFSRGTVHLQSSDPLVPPAINPAYYSNPLDLQIMVAAVKFIRKISTVEPFASTIITPVEPGPQIQTDEQFADYCKEKMQTVFHPVGTASMLPKEDGGVVSPSLLVYGTKNIRVVDASVIPMQLSCHIQATVYAIAEKAADIIKDELGL